MADSPQQPPQSSPGQQAPSPQGPPGFTLQPGQQPTPEQIEAIRRQLAIDAQKAGLSVPEFVQRLRQQAMAQQQAAMAQQQTPGGLTPGGQTPGGLTPQTASSPQSGLRPPQSAQTTTPGSAQPITPGPPNPAALAVAAFLKNQDLKMRTCILNGQRKDMFKVKRALRALQSPAYEKARKRNPLLPAITDRASLENTFKLLPMSLLALRVTKIDPHEGHNHAPGAHKTKRVKGLWTVRIEQQQDCREELHYAWFYEGAQIKQKLYAAGALALVFALVMFPLWPIKLRLGVWYLSMGMLGLIGLFFVMAIFRLILFGITMFVVPPGLWLYPNLFEDVGFFDSFRPVWAWQEDKKAKKKKKSRHAASASAGGGISALSAIPGQPSPATATTATGPQILSSPAEPMRRHVAPTVEEVDED